MGWKYTKDGHLQMNGDHYDALKRVLCAQQDGKCADCSGTLFSKTAHLHHLDKRGMGGGKREEWIGNDPALVKVAKELAEMVNSILDALPYHAVRVLGFLEDALAHAKVTTVTLLCPACHGKRHK